MRSRYKPSKPMVMIAVCIFAVLALAGSTFAWFVATDARTNKLKGPPPGEFSVLLVDEFENTPDENGVYSKTVGADNTGSVDAFVRLMVVPTLVIENSEGPDTLWQ
ncbi:MAG: hypothetical protein FWD16_05880 [Clostridia bacterium]|nr:hypothetical protein [Clostridia bacterium]